MLLKDGAMVWYKGTVRVFYGSYSVREIMVQGMVPYRGCDGTGMVRYGRYATRDVTVQGM